MTAASAIRSWAFRRMLPIPAVHNQEARVASRSLRTARGTLRVAHG